MSSARRRANSSNVRPGLTSRDKRHTDKLRINIQDNISPDPTLKPWRAWCTVLSARVRSNKSRLLVFTLGIFLLCLTVFAVVLIKPTSMAHRPMDVTYPEPFPNTRSLSSHGITTAESISLGGLNASCPSQVTFILPITKKDIINTVALISGLQATGCPIHLLESPTQNKDLSDSLEALLPTMHHVSIFRAKYRLEENGLATIHHAKSVQTPWVWILGSMGVAEISLSSLEWMDIVGQIPRAQVPMGMYGARLHGKSLVCTPRTSRPEPVAFLVPPFIAPTSLLLQAEFGIATSASTDIWASLGERVARVTGLGMGGMLFPSASASPEPCKVPHTWGSQSHYLVSERLANSLLAQFRFPSVERIRFAFALPNMASLRLVAPTACRMLQNGHDVYLSVRANPGKSSDKSNSWQHLNLGCHLHYHLAPLNNNGYDVQARMGDWCLSDSLGTKVLIVTELDSSFGHDQVSLLRRDCPHTASIIHLPYDDLQDSEWFSMLTHKEWQAWNIPEIDLAVITHDRPWSLSRLLASIKRSHYFGDAISVVINLEQTADLETRRIAENFTMNSNGGHIAVRHRIVYAGLMTAVVESWHPHGNHSYGVLLEDDVELSPMFYAWIKFCVLRYRYGTQASDSSQLYGVSLYQPKVSELRMEGRRPFDPKDMFTKLELEYPHTPYLSQVPCSWGAVYFPEHWREFQQYLALRLSEHLMPVSDIVVPNLRSNRWSRSWKKFFNEMVFLRGYVSLYPNYDYFVSLSTNHLEVGEHILENVDQEKQKQYLLPLMRDAAAASLQPSTVHAVKILDLPLSTLPEWSSLPILDLWGDVSSLKNLQVVGLARRANMSVCDVDKIRVDVLRFLCPLDKTIQQSEASKQSLSALVEDEDVDLMQG